MEHRLRHYVVTDSPEITDAELDEFFDIVDFELIEEDYEYAGNYCISKDVADRDEAICKMCCGIATRDIVLSNGQTIYFAFDYGH